MQHAALQMKVLWHRRCPSQHCLHTPPCIFTQYSLGKKRKKKTQKITVKHCYPRDQSRNISCVSWAYTIQHHLKPCGGNHVFSIQDPRGSTKAMSMSVQHILCKGVLCKDITGVMSHDDDQADQSTKENSRSQRTIILLYLILFYKYIIILRYNSQMYSAMPLAPLLSPHTFLRPKASLIEHKLLLTYI